MCINHETTSPISQNKSKYRDPLTKSSALISFLKQYCFSFSSNLYTNNRNKFLIDFKTENKIIFLNRLFQFMWWLFINISLSNAPKSNKSTIKPNSNPPNRENRAQNKAIQLSTVWNPIPAHQSTPDFHRNCKFFFAQLVVTGLMRFDVIKLSPSGNVSSPWWMLQGLELIFQLVSVSFSGKMIKLASLLMCFISNAWFVTYSSVGVSALFGPLTA